MKRDVKRERRKREELRREGERIALGGRKRGGV